MAAPAGGSTLAGIELFLEICGAMKRFRLWHDGQACTTNYVAYPLLPCQATGGWDFVASWGGSVSSTRDWRRAGVIPSIELFNSDLITCTDRTIPASLLLVEIRGEMILVLTNSAEPLTVPTVSWPSRITGFTSACIILTKRQTCQIRTTSRPFIMRISNATRMMAISRTVALTTTLSFCNRHSLLRPPHPAAAPAPLPRRLH